jgi:hypothetical protein
MRPYGREGHRQAPQRAQNLDAHGRAIAAKVGPVPWTGRTIWLPQHLDERLLDPGRLEEILRVVLDRRQERIGHWAAHVTELRKKAAEADARLKRLSDTIEGGVADIQGITEGAHRRIVGRSNPRSRSTPSAR